MFGRDPEPYVFLEGRFVSADHIFELLHRVIRLAFRLALTNSWGFWHKLSQLWVVTRALTMGASESFLTHCTGRGFLIRLSDDMTVAGVVD